MSQPDPHAPVVGVLHPGRMGAGIAAQARRNAAEVLWCPSGRSDATRARAEAAVLLPVATVTELVERSDIILSICPPTFAETVAAELGRHDLSGRIIVEANPLSSPELERILSSLKVATVIDGAIIGSVPGDGKKPALYTSGPEEAVATIEALFAGTDVIVRNLSSEPGQASALKLAYSTFQKGSRVLAALAQALADNHGVGAELLVLAEQRSGSYLAEPDYVAETAALAWRWSPDLVGAAAELDTIGLPGAAVRGLADVLDLWQDQRDDWNLTPAEAVEALRRTP